jgi:hypothetical protein
MTTDDSPVDTSKEDADRRPDDDRHDPTEGSAPPGPVVTLDDPRALQILATEHWSLLPARSLAYNEAFTRGGMFLTFLSTSFVALALAAQAMSFGSSFLVIAAIVLAFDLIIGLTTYGRILGANYDDFRAVHGMSRIRHGYAEIAPIVAPYFTTGTTDDMRGVMLSYGTPPSSGIGLVWYSLTTSGGMIGLITALVAGVLVGVIVLMLQSTSSVAIIAGVIGTAATYAAIQLLTGGYFERRGRDLPTLFPSEDPER